LLDHWPHTAAVSLDRTALQSAVHTWDPDRFPDPAALLHELRTHDVRVVTIIDAGVKEDLGSGYDVADDGIARDMFIRTADGAPFAGYCWPGLALFPDFTRSDVRAWWGARHASLLDAGVAGIWNDMNEPSIFDRPFTSERLSTSAAVETLTLALYPEGMSAWTLVEDDGTTFGYQRGEIAETAVRMTEDDGRVSVEVMARRGDFQPHPRTLAVRLRTAWRPDSVLLDGRSVDWRWNEPEDVVALSWADDGRDHRLECRIDGPQGGDSGMLE